MGGERDGILVVDKPEGITSAGAVAVVKRALKATKVGHTGTLDPFSSGVLICCLNRATRLARFFLHGEKTYRAVLRLGIETDTLDATGAVLAVRKGVGFSETEIRDAFERFKGKTRQQPPVFSALKHNGTPLYRLARQGKPVSKPAREIRIDAINIREIDLPDVRFELTCSAGTYVRTLCADVGTVLGCGGHLRALRRTQNSGFTEAHAVDLLAMKAAPHSEVFAERVVAMADALHWIPAHIAGAELIEKITHGRRLHPDDFGSLPPEPKNGLIKIVDEHNKLYAVIHLQRDAGQITYCCVFN